jgi:hypothetical protein
MYSGRQWDGYKQLASEVILRAIEDYRRRQTKSAYLFLAGKTKSPIKGESMLEFCCALAGIEHTCIYKRVLGGQYSGTTAK